MDEKITVYVLINSSKQWPMNCSVNQSQKLGQLGGLHKLRWQATICQQYYKFILYLVNKLVDDDGEGRAKIL